MGNYGLRKRNWMFVVGSLFERAVNKKESDKRGPDPGEPHRSSAGRNVWLGNWISGGLTLFIWRGLGFLPAGCQARGEPRRLQT